MEDTNSVPSEVQADDRRAAIEAAFDAAEAQAAQEGEHVETEAQDDNPATEEVTEHEPVEHAETEEQPEAVEEEEEQPVAEEREATDKPLDIKRAPQGWKPEARETWGELPESAKREIIKREREIAVSLQKTAHERKFASEISEVFKPYEAELRAAGFSEKEVIADFLNASYTLRRGNQSERATFVANIINAHGVDLVTLNDVLMKKQPAQTAQDPTAQRLAQLEAAEQARQRQVQQAQEADLNSQIDAFAKDPKNEFFRDVAPMMVTFLQGGHAADLKNAYDMAVAANPETRKVLEARRAKATTTQSKLAAASSVKGSGPRGSVAPTAKKPASTQPNDRRSTIASFWDELSTDKKRF